MSVGKRRDPIRLRFNESTGEILAKVPGRKIEVVVFASRNETWDQLLAGKGREAFVAEVGKLVRVHLNSPISAAGRLMRAAWDATEEAKVEA